MFLFQEVIEAQDKTITSLLKAVQEQHEQLDHQKIKIKNMEEKVNNGSVVQISSICEHLETQSSVQV